MHFIAPAGQTSPMFDSPVEKNCVQHEKNIYFSRVFFALALLGHQTLNLQNKLFSP